MEELYLKLPNFVKPKTYKAFKVSAILFGILAICAVVKMSGIIH